MSHYKKKIVDKDTINMDTTNNESSHSNKNNYISKWKFGGEESVIQTDPKKQLVELSKLFLNSPTEKFKEYEVEAKFGNK